MMSAAAAAISSACAASDGPARETALADLARSVGADASVRINGDVDRDVAVAAWFAGSEAVTNALRHAGPARLWLSAVTEGACLRVQVTDDGVGGADPHGRGLRGLAERLAGHGGQLYVSSGEHGGTIVVAEIPLHPSRQAVVASEQFETPG
jgi:signal transduction histidine kinase